MTAAERRFWSRIRARVARQQPDMAAALLRSFENIRKGLNPADLTRLIRDGSLERLITEVLNDPTLDRAFLPLTSQLQRTTEAGFKATIGDLPRAGMVDGVRGVAFNVLSPDVLTALGKMNDQVLTTLKADIRETVREAIARGLADAEAPATIARGLRSVIGLAPNQASYVDNLRRELETGKYADAARRTLIDKRFNLAKLDALPASERAARIDAIVDAYRKSWLTTNATVNTKTATFDAYKLGQKLSWNDAMQNDVIPTGFIVMRTWRHQPGQKDPRPEHEAMDGETVPAGEPYTNGDTYAGEGDPWNCHCIDRFHLARDR